MRRRDLIKLISFSAATWPLASRAQQPAQKLPTVGFLGATPSSGGQRYAAFVQRLSELGWVDGRNVKIDIRWAEGRSERLAEIASEFAAQNVNVIVTSGGVVPTVMKVTSVIPIVFTGAIDPVGAGYVATLAKPGRNITGLSQQSFDTVGKRIELLRGVLPDLGRLAILTNAANPGNILETREVEREAHALAIDVAPSEVGQAEDIMAAFAAFKDTAQALYVVSSPITTSNRVRINTLALGAHLPAIYADREFVETGGLMSYGADNVNLHRRAAEYVDKILRGARPADLPVEQPIKFDLVINLTTAKTLGLTIPNRLLALAEDVIE